MPSRRTLVPVPADVVAEIDALVGRRKRSAFVVDLARKELRRQRLLKVFESKEPIWRMKITRRRRSHGCGFCV